MSRFGPDGRFELRHEGAAALLEYWLALRAGRNAPGKSEVTAEGLGRALAGHVFIMERLEDGALRYRLAGSRLYDLFGLELRGASGAIIFDAMSRPRFSALAAICLADAEVGVIRGAAAHGAEELQVEILLAPLSGEDGRLTRLIGCAWPLDRPVDEISPAPRRLRISETAAMAAAGEPEAAGLAEDAAPFEREALRTIKGGAEKTGGRRRGHLRVVKD